MDKTIELVVVAMVILVAATILLFLVQDRTDSFGGFLDNQQSSAQCDLLKAQERCEEFDSKNCNGSCPDSSQNNVPDCPEGEVPNGQGRCTSEDSVTGL